MHKHSFLYALLACTLLLVWAAPNARAQVTLRNGDVLEIKISGIPPSEITAVSGEYTIDGEGFLNMPYIGRVKVAGLSAGMAQGALESVYRNRDIYTNPTIIISQQLQSRFVNVGGEVKTPQRIPYTAGAANPKNTQASQQQIHRLHRVKGSPGVLAPLHLWHFTQ